ncbi:MAG: 6-phosphogluconolactonase [Alphaproteobacteria bacterium]|nr:6-phosphogluconolactonase [Alphaproteobacteria bacterium]
MITGQHHFAGADALARMLAVNVAASLRQALAGAQRATLAVSGGTTPQKFFEALSKQKLDWAQVTVTLVDERQVPETSDRSNARLVKAALIQNEAAAARFVPLFQNPTAAALPDFDVVILGMGNDGHTASFFPGGDRLAEALSPTAPPLLAISAPGAGEPRLTFSLRKLLAAKEIILHIQGADKAATLEKAQAGNDVLEMPVRSVLQSGHQVETYWCP